MEHTDSASFEMKLEVWISTLAPVPARIAPPYKLHVPHQELERKVRENSRKINLESLTLGAVLLSKVLS
jgi:hypothetical protein